MPRHRIEMKILKRFLEVEPYLELVQEYADKNKNELGFLPLQAYREQAIQNKIWVAVNTRDKSFAGYLMFGDPFPKLRIEQIFVLPIYRRSKIGTALISALIKFGEKQSYMTAQARVAADLEATNTFWAKNGFSCIRQVKGGKSRNRLINLRAKNLDTPTLFDSIQIPASRTFGEPEREFPQGKPILDNRTYTIDLNVLFDLTDNRPRADSVGAVFRAGWNNEIRIRMTNQFIEELERNQTRFGDDPILDLCRKLPVLPAVPSVVVTPVINALSTLLFPGSEHSEGLTPQKVSDLAHLAESIHHRMDGFITSDQAILRRGKEIQEQYGLTVISPIDFFDSIEVVTSGPDTLSVSVEARDLKILEFSEDQRVVAEDFLIDLGLHKQRVREPWIQG